MMFPVCLCSRSLEIMISSFPSHLYVKYPSSSLGAFDHNLRLCHSERMRENGF